jgi:hypothetical protein
MKNQFFIDHLYTTFFLLIYERRTVSYPKIKSQKNDKIYLLNNEKNHPKCNSQTV